MKQVTIGPESSFSEFPVEVEIERSPYFLVKVDKDYRLFSRICPHVGGLVHYYEEEATLLCPVHYWSFDKQTGKCKEIPGECLDSVPVIVQDGILIAEFANRF